MTFSTIWPRNWPFGPKDNIESLKLDQKWFFQAKLDEIEVLHLFVVSFKKKYVWPWHLKLTLDFVIIPKTLKDILLISGGYDS